MPPKVRRLRDRPERFEYIVENYDMDDTELLEGGKDHLKR